MASDDDEPIVDFYAHQFNIEEAARLSGAKPDRIRSWLLHEVVPDIGLKHPKLRAWLFNGLDIIRLRAMVDAADIQDNIATAAKVSEIVRDPDAQKLGEAQDELRSTADDFSSLGKDAMGGFIRDLKDGKSATDALMNAVSRLTDKLLDMALDGLFSGKSGSAGILGNIFSGIFGGSGATAGAGFTGAGIYHTGGLVGAGSLSRNVPAALFAGAPRYHSGGIAGLKPDEIPAILQRGEYVVSKANMAAAAVASRKSAGVSVVVNNNAPVTPEVKTSQGPNGTINVEVLIDQIGDGLAAKAARGHGNLGKAVTSAATGRNLRG